MSLPIFENHETGTLNVNGIINGNWDILNDLVDPALASGDPLYGIFGAAVNGQRALTIITYANPFDVSLRNRQNLCTLTGDAAVTVSDQTAGRFTELLLVASGADRAVTWPAGAVWCGPDVATVVSGTAVLVRIIATTGADSGLRLIRSPLAYSASTGLSLSGGGAFAIDSTVMTLTGVQTATNKTFTSPTINAVLDTGGNPAVTYTATASAVNGLTFSNAATGTGPTIAASGSDTDVDLLLAGKGAGVVRVKTFEVGFRHIPQNSQSADYTAVAEDSGKHILHPAADTTARVFTIPSNASVPYLVGTVLQFIAEPGSGVVTIAITSDTLVLAGAGTTGSRTLTGPGLATAIKITSTKWLISGAGLT